MVSLKCSLAFKKCHLNRPNIPFLVCRKRAVFDTEQLLVVYLKVIVLSYVVYFKGFQSVVRRPLGVCGGLPGGPQVQAKKNLKVTCDKDV